jgi:hypothetical protein
MQAPIKKPSYTGAIIFIAIFGVGAWFALQGIVDTFFLGAEIIGITKYALMYYVFCMVISAGILITSRAVRKVGIFMALYPFGLATIFIAGFSSIVSNPSSNPLSDQLAGIQVFGVHAFVWSIPAFVTGYYIVKAFRESREVRV